MVSEKSEPNGYLQNPAVLKAAMEMVRRKKAEAIEKEDFDVAARFHQKLQDLEEQLRSCESESSEGSRDAPAQRHSLFAAPNPFRTVGLLQQSGYSRFQACGLLVLLYLAVFIFEMALLYAGWSYWESTSGEAVDGYDEF